jgi:tRNA(Ile)-lysidine synthase TilS/MesJ
MPNKPRAISVAEFSPILRTLGLLGKEMAPPLAIGLSGNPESLALVALLKASDPSMDLTALTFDHGQSPAASDLAEDLGRRMADMGAYLIHACIWMNRSI